jgi:hypothetical protein
MNLTKSGDLSSGAADGKSILPTRWSPIVVLVIGVLGVEIAYHRDMAVAQQYQFYLEPLAWVGFCVLPALIAMTHSPVWVRLLSLLLATLLKLVCDLASIWLLKSEFFLPEGEFESSKQVVYEGLQRFVFDLRGFAVVCVVMHASTALCGAFVSSRSTQSAGETTPRLGSTGEWLYFALLVALVFGPQLSPWQSVFSLEEEGAPILTWWSMQILMTPFVLFPLIGVSFVGLLALAPWNAWSFRAMAAIVHLSVLMVFLFSRKPVDWGLIGGLLFDFGPLVILTLPHWILVRIAGYRLSSPRGWLQRAV